MMPADLKRLHKYMMEIDGISVISDEIRTARVGSKTDDWKMAPPARNESAAAQLGVHASFATKS